MAPETVFSLLSDTTRLRCLSLIYQKKELCVCELTYALEMVQPKVSRHLALLKSSGLVADRREGLWILYRLQPNLPKWISHIFEITFKQIASNKQAQVDLQRLKAMPNQPIICQLQRKKMTQLQRKTAV